MLGFKKSSAAIAQSTHCLLKSVGIAEFDKQHLRLGSYAVEFHQIEEELSGRDPTQDDWKHIDGLFCRTKRCIALHFSEEEAMMLKHNYPSYSPHKRMHDDFLQKMQKIQSQINNRNIRFIRKMDTLLWDWFYHHINEVDYKYREFFLERGEE